MDTMSRETCKKCGKVFAYEFWGTVYPGGKDREYVDCPYCGETAFSRMTSQCVAIRKLDEQGNVIN